MPREHRTAGSDYGRILRGMLDPEMVMDRLLDEFMKFIPAAEGTIVGLADHSGRIRFVRTGGVLHGLVGASISQNASLSGLSMRSGKVLCCDDASTDMRVDRVLLEQIEKASLMSIPLVREGVAFGVIDVVSTRRHAFSDVDIDVGVTLADVLAGLISLSAEADRLFGMLDSPLHGVEQPCPINNCEDRVAHFVTTVLSPAATKQVDCRQRISEVLRGERRLAMVFQPVLRLESMETVALEALARFRGPPAGPPDRWFADAHSVGLGVELEMLAFRSALETLASLPNGVALAVNLGPTALCAPEVAHVLGKYDASRVVIELTEHAPIADYPAVNRALSTLRHAGARLAVDDTGMGFSSLAHIAQLKPDLVKLDRWMVDGIDRDPVKQTLVKALITLATHLDAQVIAEGIETAGELHTLGEFGVPFGQGYHLGRPKPLPGSRLGSAHGTLVAAGSKC
jgi:EAL domain-containing protein (putative c-di-GMP-specific phosphodiesterase class I)